MGGVYSFPSVGQSSGHTFRYNYIHDSGRSPNGSLLGNSFYFDLAHEAMTLYGNLTHNTIRQVWYKHANQFNSGVPQPIYNYNNLSITDGTAFEYVAPKLGAVGCPASTIANNAAVGANTTFVCFEVPVSNGATTGTAPVSTTLAALETTANSNKATPATWAQVVDLGVRPAGPLSVALTGLSAGTTYYYRFFASNSAGAHWATATTHTTAAGVATALAPVNPLLLHHDASAATTIVKDGANKVSRWNDADGGPNCVDQSTVAAQPTAVLDAAANNKTVVDFGPLLTNSSGQWMQFNDASGAALKLTSIRSVIAVMKGANHLLGEGTSYHFHRNDPTLAPAGCGARPTPRPAFAPARPT